MGEKPASRTCRPLAIGPASPENYRYLSNTSRLETSTSRHNHAIGPPSCSNPIFARWAPSTPAPITGKSLVNPIRGDKRTGESGAQRHDIHENVRLAANDECDHGLPLAVVSPVDIGGEEFENLQECAATVRCQIHFGDKGVSMASRSISSKSRKCYNHRMAGRGEWPMRRLRFIVLLTSPIPGDDLAMGG